MDAIVCRWRKWYICFCLFSLFFFFLFFFFFFFFSFFFSTQVPSIEIHAIDLGDWNKTRSLVKGLGPIDLLVNNAGRMKLTSFLDVTKEEIDA